MKRNKKVKGAGISLDDLPDAELEVLASLWQCGEATVRDLRERMASFRPMTHGAMATLLKRLEQKELVSKRKGTVGKALVYGATRSPKRTYRSIMEKMRERIFGGSGVAMVTSLFETRPPSPEELEELQALLDRLREKHEDRGDQS